MFDHLNFLFYPFTVLWPKFECTKFSFSENTQWVIHPNTRCQNRDKDSMKYVGFDAVKKRWPRVFE